MMTGGSIHHNRCNDGATGTPSDTGTVRVETKALVDFRGGTIGASDNPRNAAIYLHPNGGLGRLSMQGTATVQADSHIYLATSGPNWASVSVPVAFTGSASLKSQRETEGTVLVRGEGLTSSSLANFSLAEPSGAWLTYSSASGVPEVQLGRS